MLPYLGDTAYQTILRSGGVEAPALPPLEPVVALADGALAGEGILSAEERELHLAVAAPRSPTPHSDLACDIADAPVAHVPAVVEAVAAAGVARFSSCSACSSTSSDDIMEPEAEEVWDGWENSMRREVRAGEHSRCIATCRHHHDCQRKPICGALQREQFGPWEPVGYLMAWHALGAHLDRETHKGRDTQPTGEQIQVW